MVRNLLIGLVGLVSLASVAGCGGSLSPLYADFRIASDEEYAAWADSLAADSLALFTLPDSLDYTGIQARIAEALLEIGWELDEAPSENAISTSEILIAEWGLYSVRVSLDVVPINQKYVRVYVHPYRQYFWGSRNKLSYMNRRVRSSVFPDLAQAFAARGIVGFGVSPPKNADEAETEDESQESVSATKGLTR